MKRFFLYSSTLLFVSCTSKQTFQHKTYDVFSIGVTSDSTQKIYKELVENNKIFNSKVEVKNRTLVYVKNYSAGKPFNMYLNFSTQNNYVVSTFFYISTNTNEFVDILSTASENNGYYPLLSTREILDEDEDTPGYEQIRKVILEKLCSSYNKYSLDSTVFEDSHGTKGVHKKYSWYGIDNIMYVDFDVWETEKFCYECVSQIWANSPKIQNPKYYSRAKMYLNYYLNDAALAELKKTTKNEF